MVNRNDGNESNNGSNSGSASDSAEVEQDEIGVVPAHNFQVHQHTRGMTNVINNVEETSDELSDRGKWTLR